MLLSISYIIYLVIYQSLNSRPISESFTHLDVIAVNFSTHFHMMLTFRKTGKEAFLPHQSKLHYLSHMKLSFANAFSLDQVKIL